MKTLKLVGVTLLALFSFVACDDPTNDPSDPTGNPSVSEKRLARTMKYEIENGKEELNAIIDFKYNQENRLTKVYERVLYSDGWYIDTLNYIWDSNNSVTYKWHMESEAFIKFILSNNKVTSIQYHEKSYNPIIGEYVGYYDYYEYYEYNNAGNIKEIGEIEDNGEKEPEEIFTWENGNLTSFEEYSYIYDNKTCNGSFPLFYEYAGWDDELYIFMAQPELIGIKTKNLPKMIINDPYTYTFEYEFDQDNYITSCTMNKEYYDEYGYSKEYYFEFVWE